MSSSFTRRNFLRWASAGAGAAAAGAAVWRLGDDPSTVSAGLTPPTGSVPAARARGVETTVARSMVDTVTQGVTATGSIDDRRLVVIEFNGGNDGLSTLVPYGLGSYRDLRSGTAVDAADVMAIDDEFGFHRNLGRLSARGLAAVQGVGSFSPDGSHFEMLRRWWAGDPDGTGAYDTGLLGRLADLIGDPAAAAVAISIGAGTSPALISRTVSTLALPNADAVGYLTGAGSDDAIRYAFQRGFAQLSSQEVDGILGRIRGIGRQTTAFAAEIAAMSTEFDDEDADRIEYPGSALGNGLRLTADLVAADNGVRIVHLPMGADFDTHDNHRDRHANLLDEFDAAVDAFLGDLDRRGIADRVLVMTTSEFGRRAGDGGADGLDHGTASTALLAGPVVAGRYGEHPSLTSLDENDNLVATLGLDSYYASVAEGWFGVPASELFDSAPEIISGLFT